MNMTLLRSIRWCFLVACISAISSAGVASAYQAGDVWAELGEDFIGSGSDTAQSTIVGDTYVLPSSGAEVIVAEGFAPEESDMEDQLIFIIPQGMGAVAVLPGLESPVTAMELYVGAFAESPDNAEEIDVQVGDDAATGLYLVDVLDTAMFMFISVDYQTFPGHMTIQVVLSEAGLAEGIAVMRENIAVNDRPMFTGIDELEVQDTADQYLSG